MQGKAPLLYEWYEWYYTAQLYSSSVAVIVTFPNVHAVADLEGVPWVPWNPSFEDPPLFLLLTCANEIMSAMAHAEVHRSHTESPQCRLHRTCICNKYTVYEL